MSILPVHVGYRDPFRAMWRGLERPFQIFDQYFGMGLDEEDLLPYVNGFIVRPRAISKQTRSGVSEVTLDKDKFQVTLDVAHFNLNEITVKTVDSFVIVEAKHEEKPDEHGYVYRHFTRRYAIPEGVNQEQIVCQLSPDGVLTIGAPRAAKPITNERVVPIQTVENIATAPPNIQAAVQTAPTNSIASD